MDAVKITVGIIIVVLAIYKTIRDDIKKKSSKTPLPLTTASPSVNDLKPSFQNSSDAHVKLEAKKEGLRAVAPESVVESEATQPVPRKRNSSLRTAFINSEILNRKF